MKREVDLGALLKLNGFTYYMEHQYAFAKHPDIGPKDGSLLPAELKALNDYYRLLKVELIGCQQSFGHLTDILQHEACKELRETLFTICPTNEGTYKLLDDLYSEEAPLLDSRLFNVYYDETFDLGTGPSKALAEQPHRVGLTVAAGDVARVDLPIELDLPALKGLGSSAQLMEPGEEDTQRPVVLCQTDSVKKGKRLSFLLPGRTEAGATRRLLLYYGGPKPSKPQTGASEEKADEGMLWFQNAAVRPLIGKEGAHIYRWEVNALGALDLTEPGDAGWAGFADISPGAPRSATNKLEAVSSGPALVRVRCTGPDGVVKTISLWAGVPWAEVTLNTPSSWFWCYDDISLMGAESKTPGSYLFPGGATGPLRPTAGVESQEARGGVQWGAKFVPDGVLLVLLTPGASVRHIVGPGSGMGGVGIDGGPPAAHFVIYGGSCRAEPGATLDAQAASLDFTRQPEVTVFGSEKGSG